MSVNLVAFGRVFVTEMDVIPREKVGLQSSSLGSSEARASRPQGRAEAESCQGIALVSRYVKSMLCTSRSVFVLRRHVAFATPT